KGWDGSRARSLQPDIAWARHGRLAGRVRRRPRSLQPCLPWGYPKMERGHGFSAFGRTRKPEFRGCLGTFHPVGKYCTAALAGGAVLSKLYAPEGGRLIRVQEF